MTPDQPLIVSNLTHVYTHPQSGLRRLSMAEISDFNQFACFQDLRNHVLNTLRYPKPQQDKFESYGWVPSLFDISDRTFRRRSTGEAFLRRGSWRNGQSELDWLTVFYADVDNDTPGMPIISMDEVARNFSAHGLNTSFFTYTSFSHTPEKPKFRLVIAIDRLITRTEMLRMFVWINATILGGQGDASIYDPGDFIFAPPHQTLTSESMDGLPLAVDDILRHEIALRLTRPDLWASYFEQRQPKVPRVPRALTAEQAQQIELRKADMTCRPEIGIASHDVFNPAWTSLYRDAVVGGSHWETMRSVLAMVWAKNFGDLTRGEMERIFGEIDATDAAYFMLKHGSAKRAELIDWIMSLPVEPNEAEWHPILEQEESGLVVDAVEGECGEGKTHFMLCHMARHRGRYIYVVDKIENIDKRRTEFFTAAGPNIAPRFFVREAHSKEEGLRVPLQLRNVRKDLDKLAAGAAAIVFVTQAGAMQMDWSAWTDFEFIMDEVPEVSSVFKLKVGNHVDLFRRYVSVATGDGNCHRLELTELGAAVARSSEVDDYDAVHHGLLNLLAKPNTFVWVKKEGWDNPESGGKLEFFGITSPLNLRTFRKVWMLGDELTTSITVKAWQAKWGVTFQPVEFNRQTRTVPTSQRTSIYYFSEHRDSSLTRFNEGDMPLTAICDWIKVHAGKTAVLWTANERLKSKASLDPADYISPKAHGRNDLMHHTHVAWLAAMKPSKFEIATLREVTGVTASDLVEWREFNALYQFVMRSALRRFDSGQPATIYVFSRRQADYLHRRLGGTLHKVEGIVIDQPIRCLDAEGPMNDSERQRAKYWRDRMQEAGVEDVRVLPKTNKLDERMIRLINDTFRRRANDDADGHRSAA